MLARALSSWRLGFQGLILKPTTQYKAPLRADRGSSDGAPIAPEAPEIYPTPAKYVCVISFPEMPIDTPLRKQLHRRA